MLTETNEQGISYIQATVALLGGADILGENIEDNEHLITVVSDGLPRQSMQALLSKLNGGNDDSRAVFAWLQDKLIEDSGSQDPLSPMLSDYLLRIALLLVALIGVFEDADQAIEFLLAPHKSLDDVAPVQAIVTPSGVQAVNELVGRAMHGMPA